MKKEFEKILEKEQSFVSNEGVSAPVVKESTFVIIKPDCTGNDAEAGIVSMIKSKGYEIIKSKRMLLTEEIVREHYAHHADKPFFPEILKYMRSGPVLAMVVTGGNVVQGMCDLAGNIGVDGTIRGIYGKDKCENGFHRSDSLAAAEVEIKRFFGEQ